MSGKKFLTPVLDHRSYERAKISDVFFCKMSAAGVEDAASKRILRKKTPKDSFFHRVLTQNWRFLVGITALLGMAEVHADFFAAGKIAYFRPCQDKFRDIYSTGGGMFGVEASGLVGGHVYFWGSGDYFHASGSSNPSPAVSTTSTHVTMVPIGMGLKYLYPVSFADFYLGAGFAETWLQIRGISPFTTKTRSQWGPGGMFKAGAVFNLKHQVILDFFTNYLLTSMQLEHGRSKANVSGWSVGVGLGFRLGPRLGPRPR